MKKESQKQDAIEIRLNAIIRLLSDFLISQDSFTKGSVYQSLNHAGLGPSEIGNLFGKTKGEIGSELFRTKKSKNKKGEKNE